MKYQILGLAFLLGLSASTQLIAEQKKLNLNNEKNEKLSPSLQRFYKSVDTLHIGLNKNLYYKILQQKPLTLSVPKERVWPTNNDLKDKSGHIIKPRVQILMTTLIPTRYDETSPYNVEKLIDLLKQGHITVAQLNHFAGGDAVWLTVAGKLKEKMKERNKSWDFKLANSCQKIDLEDHNQDLDDNKTNPCNQIMKSCINQAEQKKLRLRNRSLSMGRGGAGIFISGFDIKPIKVSLLENQFSLNIFA